MTGMPPASPASASHPAPPPAANRASPSAATGSQDPASRYDAQYAFGTAKATPNVTAPTAAPGRPAPSARQSAQVASVAKTMCAKVDQRIAVGTSVTRSRSRDGYSTPGCRVARNGEPAAWYGFHSASAPARRRSATYAYAGQK
jgi:hypothetical protein